MTKTGPVSSVPGTATAYTVTLTNNGPGVAGSVSLTDPLPGDMTFVSATAPAGFSCTTPAIGSGGVVTCTANTLPVGTPVQFTFVFEIPTNALPGTEYANTATVSSGTSDPNSGNDSSTFVTRAASADVAVFKSGPAQAAAGSDVAYIVTVMNFGPDPAPTVTLNDPIPGSMTFVSATQNSGPSYTCGESGGTVTCTGTDVPAGSTAQFTFVFNIPPATPPGTTFNNTASVPQTEPPTDPFDENNTSTASTSTPPPPQADLSVQKSGPAAAGPDADVVYTITLSNGGPDAATNVSLSETIPATLTFVSLTQTGQPLSCSVGGTIVCTAATYPAGASTTLTLTLHVPAGTPAGTEVTNTATVTSDSDPNGENNSSSTTVTISSVDVSVVKSGPASAIAGQNATYVLTVANAGPDPALSVTLLDSLPAGTTFVSLNQNSGPATACSVPTIGTNGQIVCGMALSPGQSAAFTLVVNVAPGATSFSNTATVTTQSFDTNTTNNQSTVITTVTREADLSVVKSGPASAVAGTDVTYTVSVTNAGPSDAVSLTLSDAIPPNATFVSQSQASGPPFNCSIAGGAVTCTIASFSPGASASFTFVFHVLPGAIGTVDNTAQVTSGSADPQASNNSSTVNTAVTTSADVRVAKTGPAATAANANITWNVVVANDGPSDATAVTLTDMLPALTTFVSATQTSGPLFNCVTPAVGAGGTITCTIPTLVSGASAAFTFVAHVAPTATGTIDNTATVTSAVTDPDGTDNTSTTSAAVNPGDTDLSITKTASTDRAGFGAPVTYTIVVTNNGPATAFGTTVTDVLPAGVTLQSATPSQGSCTGTTTVVCSLGTLADSASATITLAVTMPQTPGLMNNTASVSAANADPNSGNNAAAAAVAVSAEIPTASEYGLALLALALVAAAIVKMRTQ